jgi:DNA topoisomerase II
VDKLHKQMSNKKQELDDLKALSEKDLWCQDLDEFMRVWDERLAEEKDVSKKIRGLGRRVSKKIGAGKGGKLQSRLKTDEDYAPRVPKVQKANPAKGVIRVTPEKSSQKFLNMFAQKQKPKPKIDGYGGDGAGEASGMSDDDFAAVAATKDSRAASEQHGRSKRAAAVKPKNWVVNDNESDSDDDKLLGDVGDMVKGIGIGSTGSAATNGRVSLFAMSRRGSSSGTRPSSSSGLPKGKGKGRAAELTDDETNYEMLAKPSPHKTASAPIANLDSFLSDEDDVIPLPAPTKKAIVSKAAPRPKKALLPKKSAPSTSGPLKPITLSPAAKAYALKQNKMKLKPETKKVFISDDDDDDVVIADNYSSPPKPVAKRPARAAAVVKAKKPLYIDSDDDDESAMIVNDDSEDFDASD